MNFDFKISGGNEGAKITIEPIKEGEISLYKLNVELAEQAVPEKIKLEWKFPVIDCYSTWSPAMDSNRQLAPNWGKRATQSRLASWMPLHQLVSHSDKNKMCVALSDAATPTRIATGVCEEDANFDCVIDLFTGLCAPINSYSTIIRIDTRDIPFYDAVYDVTTWWETDCGYTPAFVPEAARMPVDSLWYSFHQQLNADLIVKECELSKPLGMDTVIIDDGWQTDDNNRGYAFCGDWEVAPKKMGDMRALSDRIHAVGMKLMIWYSVPFIGRFSKRYEEFKDMLCNDWGGGTFVFDPRYKKVRDYLVGHYCDAVREWNLDGLKLDFIDSFVLSKEALEPDPRRDYVSLEEAIDALMTEVKESLTAINPDILIEFRQTYIGPSIRKYGNMLRVGDCPNDAILNRKNIIDMRLTSGHTPVHSDMLMWNYNDPVEVAALQMASTLFSVPQVSVLIDHLNDEHKRMVKFYLDFWRANRTTLLDGKITASAPASGYSKAEATLNGYRITATYTDPIAIFDGIDRLTAVNCSKSDTLIIKGAKGKSFKTVNCMGDTLESGSVNSDLFEIKVPLSGMITVE